VARHSADNSTVYSQIADLKDGEFYVDQQHRFNRKVKIELSEDLKKGAYRITVKSLFPPVLAIKMNLSMLH